MLRGLDAAGDAGDKGSRVAEALLGSVLQLSLDDGAACRAVQRAIEVADAHTRSALVQELHGHVRDLVASPHGNYVVQKVVEVMPTNFVAEELRGIGAEVARHRYGCRILCRLLQYASGEASTLALVDEVLARADSLCRHPFARHVLQSVLEHGVPSQRHRVAETLRGNLHRNAMNRSASYVIESALNHCSYVDQQAMAGELLASWEEPEKGLAALAVHPFGSFVVKALGEMSAESHRAVLCALRPVMAKLRADKNGSRLLEQLELDG